MSDYLHCDNCETPTPVGGDDAKLYWLKVRWHGINQDLCSAACAVELIERQHAEDVEAALALNDDEDES